MFLPAIWPWLALAIKRLRDSGRSAGLGVPFMLAWVFAGVSLLAGKIEMIGPLTTLGHLSLRPQALSYSRTRSGSFYPLVTNVLAHSCIGGPITRYQHDGGYVVSKLANLNLRMNA